MAERFVPVPYVALRIVGRAGRLLVLELYERAHEAGWRSFPISERDLAEDTGLSGRRVWAALDALHDGRMLLLERSPGSRKPSKVTVYCPTRELDDVPVKQAGQQAGQQSGQRETAAPTDTVDESAALAAAHAAALAAAPHVEETHARQETREETREETRDDAQPSSARAEVPTWCAKEAARVNVDGLAVLRFVGLVIEAIRQQAVLPERSSADGRAAIRLWESLERPAFDDLVADVVAVAEAARDCPDPLFARHVRGEGWAGKDNASRSPKTLLDPERWTDRVEVARGWRRAGSSSQSLPESAVVARLDDELARIRSMPGESWRTRFAVWPEPWRQAAADCTSQSSPEAGLRALARSLREPKDRERYVRGFLEALGRRGGAAAAWPASPGAG